MMDHDLDVLESMAKSWPVVGSQRVLLVISALKSAWQTVANLKDVVRDLRARLDTGVQSWMGEKEAREYISQLEGELAVSRRVIEASIDVVDSQFKESRVNPKTALADLSSAVNAYCDAMKE